MQQLQQQQQQQRPHYQRNMPFDLLHPNKTRSRSVQLDKSCAAATATPRSPPPAIATRSSSLAYRENSRPIFRSMLDIATAPRIAPLKALDLDELHRDVMPLSECQAPWFSPALLPDTDPRACAIEYRV